MLRDITFLNSKEIRHCKQQLLDQFGHAFTGEFVYVCNDNNRIFIVTPDLAKINLRNLIIDKIGLYLGEQKEHEFRLSKEGAQFLALDAQQQNASLKNVIILNSTELKQYFRGLDIPKDCGAESKMVLLQFESDIIGCAKYKEGIILNFMPKIHRGEVIV
ncbi:TPA: hypothetical protein HA241_02585 [Candidatus Woesearchaeota archaeon]|nr:hypothetical protein [Candidatus Woesearchaeota archaeon]